MSVNDEKTIAEPEPVDAGSRDLACMRCGYMLRGLDPGGNCPECGFPIEHSMRGDWLRYADRQWARQVLRGLQWTMLSRNVMFIAFVLLIVAGLVGSLAFPGIADTSAIAVAGRLSLGALCVFVILAPFGIAIGLWQASTPEPREGAASAGSALITRISSATVVPAFGLWIYGNSAGWTQLGLWPPADHGFAMACFLAVWMHMYVVVRQIASIERRCGNIQPKRAKRISRSRQNVKYLPFLLLFLHWTGPLRAIGAGAWTPPPKPIGCSLMGIGWLSIIGVIGATIGRMRDELDSDPHAQGHSPSPPPPSGS